ncbi:MAG: OmpA family protein [Pseudomonadota bacterium]
MKTLCALVCIALSASLPVRAQDTAIPLTKGLVYVYSGHNDTVDWENLITITELTAAEVTFGVAWYHEGKLTGRNSRRVRLEDMASARRSNDIFQVGDGSIFPGSTMSNISTLLLQELKDKGSAAVVLGTVPAGDKGGFGLSGRKFYRGEIKRVASEPISVLVNGVKRALPSIHTRGVLEVGGDQINVEDWWFDNPAFPLNLRVTQTNGRQSQIIRIDYPDAKVEAALKTTLASPACRAELHGIYFNTGSAFLLPQSDATVQQVAALLKANAGWKITVEGHTDNIGTAAANLDLSQRRAEAVRAALVSAGVSPSQLSVKGFGLSKPIDSNATLEGRARNRRVELARACAK